MRRFWSQNLNECQCGKPKGSMFWHGRAAINSDHRRELHCEWLIGNHAHMFHWGIEIGTGDSDDGVLVCFGIPYLIALYISLDGVKRVKDPRELGFRLSPTSIHLYTFSKTNEWVSKDAWWQKGLSYSFPWEYNHHKTEILDAHHRQPVDQPDLSPTVFTDISKKKGNGLGFLDRFKEQQEAEKTVSKDFPYTYRLKNGTIQNRIASVHVTRMTWRMRWWPLLPFKKVSTSISVRFDDEVGEGTGSWKGGCTGCGYEMLSYETPEDTLRRMESERKFGR